MAGDVLSPSATKDEPARIDKWEESKKSAAIKDRVSRLSSFKSRRYLERFRDSKRPFFIFITNPKNNESDQHLDRWMLDPWAKKQNSSCPL
jgi:hypothetical protein